MVGIDTSHHHHLILTGASGFLGQHFLRSLLLSSSSDGYHEKYDDGNDVWHVHALYHLHVVLPFHDQDHHQKPRFIVHPTQMDLTDTTQVSKWLDSMVLVEMIQTTTTTTTTTRRRIVCIHTAAMSSPAACEQDPTKAHAINNPVQSFFRPLFQKWSNSYNQSNCFLTFMAISTDQVYDGLHPPYTAAAADAAAASSSTTMISLPHEPCNTYGTTKLAMEQSLHALAMEFANTTAPPSSLLQVIILRTSIILGSTKNLLPHTHDTFLQFIVSRFHGPTTFYTNERRSVIAVTDVLHVLHWFVTTTTTTTISKTTTEPFQIYNLGGNHSVSRAEMAQAVWAYRNNNNNNHHQKDVGIHDDNDNHSSPPPPQYWKYEPRPSSISSSPLDITMDSRPIQILTGIRQFQTLNEIIAHSLAA
jgi:dTDP-4-dehydrorhamnose reductase